MRILRAVAIAVLLLPPGAARAVTQHIEGVALRLPERSEAYREYHRSGALWQHVEYRAPDGSLIAELRLDYRCSQSAPAFEQHDMRSGTKLGGRWEDGAYVLVRDAATRALPEPRDLVASSGFNRFVQAEWEALKGDGHIDFDFALPARLQSPRLRIQRAELPAGEPGTSVWFRISAARSWLRPFVGHIFLGYDADRRLRVYRGPSNLADSDGSALEVEISYHYGESSAPGTAPVVDAPDEPITASPRISTSIDCGEHSS
jgi:hypothetical protein